MQLNIAINDENVNFSHNGAEGGAIEGRKGLMELQFAQRRRRRFRFPCNKENHLQTAQIFRPAAEQIKREKYWKHIFIWRASSHWFGLGFGDQSPSCYTISVSVTRNKHIFFTGCLLVYVTMLNIRVCILCIWCISIKTNLMRAHAAFLLWLLFCGKHVWQAYFCVCACICACIWICIFVCVLFVFGFKPSGEDSAHCWQLLAPEPTLCFTSALRRSVAPLLCSHSFFVFVCICLYLFVFVCICL